MNDYIKRTMQLIFGLFLYALGSFLTIQANIGLAPWEAFNIGLVNLTGMLYGNLFVITSFIIVLWVFFLKEKIGIGTILNAVLIGKFVDVIQMLDIILQMQDVSSGVVMLLLGLFIICLGSYFYIGAALGCGPRDSLMVALAKRVPTVPIGVIRGLIEGAVLITGWLLGAKIGVGTVISVFGIGFILQWTFKRLNFDVKNVQHEDVIDTAKALPLPKSN